MANKYLKHDVGNIKEQEALVVSTGAPDAGAIPAADGSGRLDPSWMPAGFGAETLTIITSENLAAGDFVNVYNNAGTTNVRKADATSNAKRAHGYVLAAVLSGANASIYYGNLNNQLAGLTKGAQYYLSGTTPGGVSSTAPIATGNLSQGLGVASSATEILVEIQAPIELV